LWEITEGHESVPREVPGTIPTAATPAAADDHKGRTVAFWAKQREAMQALKVDRDVARAAVLLREAIALDPAHEDTRYYLASSLATLGDVPGALAELETLTRLNPSSHRALARWGALRAQTARGSADLVAAEASLQRAHDLNPEETGALLALGEISLLRGDRTRAEERLGAVCAANPRAAGGLFLLGYVYWARGDARRATELLARARAALGTDWKPRGSTAEGDVARKAHEDTTPLARFLGDWNGSEQPAEAYADLDRHLRRASAGKS
jgi:tetratricopeptide (TPR) repeat protein